MAPVESKSTDLYFSAYLRAIGIALLRADITVSKEGQRKVMFVFHLSNDDYNAHKTRYFSGEGYVSALTYCQALRAMKQLIGHAMRETPPA